MAIWNVHCKLRNVVSLHATWCQYGMSVASYDTWRHLFSRVVNLECPLQVTARGATSFHVMSIWNVRCKLWHVASLHFTWCLFGMSVASYDTWLHFISRVVNLECPLQVMTRGATSFHVMSIRNVRCKLWHVAPLHSTWFLFGMFVASYGTWRHFIPRDVKMECLLQVMTRGATSFHVMSIWNVCCKLCHVAPLHSTWCQYGIFVASYDTWSHFTSRDVNLECLLQVTTSGAACCYVRLSSNYALKIYSSVLGVGPSVDPGRSPYGRSGWNPEEDCFGSQSLRGNGPDQLPCDTHSQVLSVVKFLYPRSPVPSCLACMCLWR